MAVSAPTQPPSTKHSDLKNFASSIAQALLFAGPSVSADPPAAPVRRLRCALYLSGAPHHHSARPNVLMEPEMTVLYEMKSERVAQVTLDRPEKLNAFNAAMRADLGAALKKASADAAVRAVVLTGAGRAFSAGADISAVDDPYNVEDILNTEYGAFLSAVQSMPKPVISAINGPAAGIGMTLALTCDLRVMAEDAYLMSAFANIGLVPDGGLTLLLTQELGYARAYQLAIEAEKIDAGRALGWGLVNRVAATASVVGEALQWAETIAARAPAAMALTKRAMRQALHQNLRATIAFEAMLQRSAIATEDCREGVLAIFEKRKPRFAGR
jgi:2-(1,2-epoxy-1,2-dihydrophenyl)acetyl-CoA isomerase